MLQKCHFQKVQREAEGLFLIRDSRQLTAVSDLGLDPGTWDAERDGGGFCYKQVLTTFGKP